MSLKNKNLVMFGLSLLLLLIQIFCFVGFEQHLHAFAIMFQAEKWAAAMWVIAMLAVVFSTIVYLKIGEGGVLELKGKRSSAYIEDNFFKWVILVGLFLSLAFYGAVAASYYVDPVNIPYNLR